MERTLVKVSLNLFKRNSQNEKTFEKIKKTASRTNGLAWNFLELMIWREIFSLLGYERVDDNYVFYIPFIVFVYCSLFTYLFISFWLFVLDKMSVYSINVFKVQVVVMA